MSKLSYIAVVTFLSNRPTSLDVSRFGDLFSRSLFSFSRSSFGLREVLEISVVLVVFWFANEHVEDISLEVSFAVEFA